MGKQKTYLGFDDLPTYNFYKIAETTDVRWFYKSFRKNRNLELTDEESIILIDRYKETYDARIKYTNDVKSAEYYRKLTEISNLETKLFRMTSAFDILVGMPFDHKLFKDYVTYFKEDEGYGIDCVVTSEETKDKYLGLLQRKIKGFRTKLNVKKSNYSDILKPEEVTSENEKFDIIREKILLQESLGVNIDIYKCPLIEWCAMLVRAEEKSVSAKKQIEKIKQKR